MFYHLRQVFLIFFLALLVLDILPASAIAQSSNPEIDRVLVEVFKRDDCPHCQVEKAFLDDLKNKRDDFTVIYYDLYDAEGYSKWKALTESKNLPKVTPITKIGESIIIGFGTPATTGQDIINLIEKNISDAVIAADRNCSEVDNISVCDPSQDSFFVSLPIIGTIINAADFSLSSLSLVLGFIDGFNPCAMWVLVAFLIVLSQVGSRKKIWQFAGLFIIAEAVMYYLILNVWFSAWDFIALDRLITPLVGFIAIAGGIFFLYEWSKSKAVCNVTSLEHQQKIYSRLQKLSTGPLTLATALAVIGVAFSVNVIEFACSIGIPQAFTKIIEINNLNWLANQFYMFLYILAYMIDDLIIFGLALYGIEKIGATSKYSQWSNLIGGFLMIILGLILILNPNLLVF